MQADQWLRDVEELKNNKARYGMLVDSIPSRGMEAARELAELFVDPCELDFRGLSFGVVVRTREDVRHFFGAALYKSRGWMLHTFHSPLVEISGDEATCRWTLYALSTSREQPHAVPDISCGIYEDRHVRTSSGWRQSHMRFVNETRRPTTTNQ